MQSAAAAVIVASLAYAGSLPLQRFVPSIKMALALDLAGGIHPTYYLRTSGSLLFGILVGAVVEVAGTRVVVTERGLAWITAIALIAALLLICVFP